MKTNTYLLYEIHNISNGKKYIGQHCSKITNKKWRPDYWGSSKELKSDIENGDIVAFLPLKYYDNIYELGHAEYRRINNKNAVKDDSYYNKSNYLSFNINFENGLSEDVKEKVSKSLFKYFKENKVSKETRDKLSTLSKGKTLSESHKRKISKSNKGKIKSEETIQKIKDNIPDKHGELNPFYGKKHSEETLQKMRKAKKVNGSDHYMYGKGHLKEGANNGMYGKKHSEETRAKLKAAWAKRKLLKKDNQPSAEQIAEAEGLPTPPPVNIQNQEE